MWHYKYDKPSVIWIKLGWRLSGIMKQEIALKGKKETLENKKNIIIYLVLMKINNKKISLQQFLPLSEAEIQGLLQPARANLAWFQSLQLPSTQSESPLVLMPLAPKSRLSFKACTQLRTVAGVASV
jgi:hypothetical protein